MTDDEFIAEYDLGVLREALLDPPFPWKPFGFYVCTAPTTEVEFWGRGVDGLPIWERIKLREGL